MIEQLLVQLRNEREQRRNVVFNTLIKDYETYCRVRTEYHQIDRIIEMAEGLMKQVDEEDVDNPAS